ncbi:hypothetical protein AVEN_64213-1 [Araneus ventricosus]|uniref:Uncharacterized protein n=1 Tax=Araneus ventricosus TaxID=182803 RepID=A0A4Y2SWA3_ARAVE|nr:hypothetical protein AVEN_64213-1 [Araneus ventricosus]
MEGAKLYSLQYLSKSITFRRRLSREVPPIRAREYYHRNCKNIKQPQLKRSNCVPRTTKTKQLKKGQLQKSSRIVDDVYPKWHKTPGGFHNVRSCQGKVPGRICIMSPIRSIIKSSPEHGTNLIL